MELVPASTCSFEVTYDRSDLHVGMSVYDNTTGTPALVSGPNAMTNIPGTLCYQRQFTPIGGKQYIIVKQVYTDVGLTTPDPNYGAGSESIIAESSISGASSGGCSVIGVVLPNPTIIGIVRC